MKERRSHRLREFAYVGPQAYFLTICTHQRDSEALLAVARYVVLNPVRAGLVKDPADYPLTGSTCYTIQQILEAADDWRPRY